MDYDIDLEDYLNASDLGLDTDESDEDNQEALESKMHLYGLSWRDFL